MLDTKNIIHVSFDNIDFGDYPDFSDAYPSEVIYLDPNTNEERLLNEQELDWFFENENSFWWPLLFQNAIEGYFI